ncbi:MULTISPECIES: Ig-like domain-containing protein [Roseobacteraceae]|uniref:Ig-like domain-containing protein n=1 Tax=Roseobacteraceae TaxID=2854170 RepID=UPI001C46B484|nr:MULTISPECIES: Ig-like domain-containing protein [Roseobacteraceae]MBV7409001.1 RTX toxin [Maritimibacter sp. DP1N21-5]MBY5934312.1 RTX toxin [Tateyamaria omphalii]
MKAIDFVVRNGAGAVQRGVVPVDGNTAVSLTSGQEISFNLRQIDLAGQQRSGDDLIITLVDGRQITLENYFNDAGVANRLFISADGYLNEVAFVETTDGELFAQYGPTEQWGKWSPSDDLIYLGRTEVANLPVTDDEEVSMLGAALLGGSGLLGGGAAAAAAVVGGAALLGGGGGGGGTGSDGGGGGGDNPPPYVPADPTVNDVGTSTDIGGDDTSTHVVTVTGTGEPGDTVEVTAGDQVGTVTIGDDGSWELDFEGDTFPGDGTVETVAEFTHTGGGSTTIAGPTFVIDTTPPDVAITHGVESVGHVVNGGELSGGVTLQGTGEAGATLEITISGVTRTVTVADDGTWEATWQPGTLADGEYSTAVTVVASDSFGNTTTITDMLVVDTVAEVTMETATVETDGIINAEEASDGVTLTGTAQAGSTVEVTFGTVVTSAIVDASGNWTATFAASDIPSGETTVAVTAVATDAAGNTATATGDVQVDTLVNALGYTSTAGGDGTINAAEAASGLVVTGVVEPGSTVSVELAGVTTAAVVAADGTWTATFAPGALPSGTYTSDMVATATDAAGNMSSVTQSVNVDTQASVLTLDGPVEGDDVINGAEASDGVVLSGTSDPGAVVDVTLHGVTHQTVTGTNGTWQAFFAASEIPEGTYDAQISATTTDAAGNTATVTDTVHVDTRVDNLSVAADAIEGDNIISEAERLDGTVVTGTTEPGSTVTVTMGSHTVPAIVDANGNWQAPFTADQIPQGEYTTDVSVTATDVAGNVATVTDTVRVDTLVNALSLNKPIAGDDVVNGEEAREGINLGGMVEPGSTVMVDFNGTVLEATVDAGGTWSLDIPPAAIPGGEYDAAITVMATDAVGNTDTLSDMVRIDTQAPDGPVIASYTRDADGIRGISTEQSDGDLSVAQVNADGSITNVVANQVDIDVLGETNFQFQTDVPDGSHLVVSSEDAAGNTIGTYVVLDDESANSTVDLGNANLGNYQIEAVELQFAEEASLTITEAQLLDLSDGTNTLTIHGGSDDKVTIAGATRTGSTTVDGHTYDVYSLGTEGTIILDDDITVNTGVV